MDVLVSFCNGGVERSAFSLLRVDLDRDREDVVDLRPLLRRVSFTGITGLCWSGGLIYAALQATPNALAIFDPSLRLLDVVRLARVRDIHSLAAAGKDLLIASTGTDEIIGFDLDSGRERVVYAASATLSDTVHLNAVCLHDGQLHASLFGRRLASGPRLGRVTNVETGATLLDGLRHPHSLQSSGRWLTVLESRTGSLHKFNRETVIEDWIRYAGYVRGFCQCDDHVVVARSAHRVISRSNMVPAGGIVGLDGLNERAPSALFIRNAGSDRSISMAQTGSEIYDIVALGETAPLARLPQPLVEAYRCLQGGRPKAAAEHLVACPEPDALHARLLAEAHRQGGALDEAERTLAAAQARDPEDRETKRLLAQVHQEQGRLPEATALLADLCGTDPASHENWIRLSACHRQAGRLGDAAAALDEALARQPARAGLWKGLGAILSQLGRPGDALAAVDRALSIAPHDTAILLQKARVLRALDRDDEALACLTLSIDIDPSIPPAHFVLAQLLERRGDLSAAQREYAAASRLQPGNAHFARQVPRLAKISAPPPS